MKKFVLAFIIVTYIVLAGVIYEMYRTNIQSAALVASNQQVQLPVKKYPPLPPDAVKISECIPDMGEHWVRPQDTPSGPYYVVYQGKVVAIEFMFKPEDLPGKASSEMSLPQFEKYMKDNSFTLQDVVRKNEAYFDLYGYEYERIHMGWSAPHAGLPAPHMDLHAYLIPLAEIQAICPNASIDQVYSPEVIKTIQDRNIPFPAAPKP